MTGYIYAIQAVTGGPIKIGWSADPVRRLASLQSGNSVPLELVGAIPEERATERRIHKLLADHRVQGEWFHEDAFTPEYLGGFGEIGLPVLAAGADRAEDPPQPAPEGLESTEEACRWLSRPRYWTLGSYSGCAPW